MVLTEDEVVEAVSAELLACGYRVDRRARTTQRGHDIIASKDGERLIVEAKGAGSSKPGTSRYGKHFTSGQVFDHVAKGVLKALRVVACGQARAAIALPANDAHRREVEQIVDVLHRLDIAVFWVHDDKRVTVDSRWQP